MRTPRLSPRTEHSDDPGSRASGTVAPGKTEPRGQASVTAADGRRAGNAHGGRRAGLGGVAAAAGLPAGVAPASAAAGTAGTCALPGPAPDGGRPRHGPPGRSLPCAQGHPSRGSRPSRSSSRPARARRSRRWGLPSESSHGGRPARGMSRVHADRMATSGMGTIKGQSAAQARRRMSSIALVADAPPAGRRRNGPCPVPVASL